MLPAVMAAMSFVLYFFAYFGVRSVGIILILIALVASVIYSLYKKIHNHDQIVQVFKSAGLIYFILMAIFIYIIARGFVFSSWDEFSHWGLVLKNIFISNNFGNLSDSTTYFQSYPPGISLFLSYFTNFSKVFSESNALRGILVLSCSQMVILFVKVKYNDWKKILLISGILLITPLILFSGFYSTIYVDAIMGLIFCNILYFNHSYHKKDLFYVIYMSLQFYLLANTKQIGIGLALIAFGAVLIDFLRLNKLKPFSLFIKNTKKELFFVFIPLLAGVLTNISWLAYVKYYDLSEMFQVSTTKFSDLFNIFKGSVPGYWKTTTTNFIMHFFNVSQHGAMFFSYFLLSLVLLAVMYYVYIKNQGSKQKSFALQAVTFIGLYVYAGVILFMYLFSFSEYEAQNLASVDRYLGTYFLGLLVFSVFILMNYFISQHDNYRLSNLKFLSLLIVLLCVTPINGLINDTVLSPVTNKVKQQFREQYENVKQYSGSLNSKIDKIYIVSQNSQGEDYWILRYNFTPVQVSPNCTWSLGVPYSPSDIWTLSKTAEEWSQDLKKYTFVYLNSIDERFINNYGQLFENSSDIKNANIYSVNKTSDGVVLKNVTTNIQRVDYK
jgi:hypothetical protein